MFCSTGCRIFLEWECSYDRMIDNEHCPKCSEANIENSICFGPQTCFSVYLGWGHPCEPIIRTHPHHPVHILLFPAASLQPIQCCCVYLWTHQHHGHGRSYNLQKIKSNDYNTQMKFDSFFAHASGSQIVGHDPLTEGHWCSSITEEPLVDTFLLVLCLIQISAAGEGGAWCQCDWRSWCPAGCGDMGSPPLFSWYVPRLGTSYARLQLHDALMMDPNSFFVGLFFFFLVQKKLLNTIPLF